MGIVVDVPVFIHSHGEARNLARKNSRCDPFYEGQAERAEHGACVGRGRGTRKSYLDQGHLTES